MSGNVDDLRGPKMHSKSKKTIPARTKQYERYQTTTTVPQPFFCLCMYKVPKQIQERIVEKSELCFRRRSQAFSTDKVNTRYGQGHFCKDDCKIQKIESLFKLFEGDASLMESSLRDRMLTETAPISEAMRRQIFQLPMSINANRRIICSRISDNVEQNELSDLINQYIFSFFEVYKSVNFSIGNRKVLSGVPDDDKFKKNWLAQNAMKQFGVYATSGKKHHYALLIRLDNKPVAIAMYHITKKNAGGLEGRTLYLAELFVYPDYQRRGIGTWIVNRMLRMLHPESRRLEVLARHQNAAAWHLYFRHASLQMIAGSEQSELVKKHGYNPNEYFAACLDWDDGPGTRAAAAAEAGDTAAAAESLAAFPILTAAAPAAPAAEAVLAAAIESPLTRRVEESFTGPAAVAQVAELKPCSVDVDTGPLDSDRVEDDSTQHGEVVDAPPEFQDPVESNMQTPTSCDNFWTSSSEDIGPSVSTEHWLGDLNFPG